MIAPENQRHVGRATDDHLSVVIMPDKPFRDVGIAGDLFVRIDARDEIASQVTADEEARLKLGQVERAFDRQISVDDHQLEIRRAFTIEEE